MRSIEFRGITVEYEEKCVLSYKWQKAVNSGDPTKASNAVERLLMGRDEEYADLLCENADPDALDTSMDAMGELLKAIMEEMGRTAKN